MRRLKEVKNSLGFRNKLSTLNSQLSTFLIICCLALTVQCSLATELDDIKTPRPPAYRAGLTDEPEKEYKETVAAPKEHVKKDTSQIDISELTYADLSIKQMSKEISRELEIDQEVMVGDL
ncbi:MAG: hypothetical protein LBJ74_02320, partial [Heliobacteriaceae bacterium]|nr:hypothetical protein [Heliobacteriaceae bacterium]